MIIIIPHRKLSVNEIQQLKRLNRDEECRVLKDYVANLNSSLQIQTTGSVLSEGEKSKINYQIMDYIVGFGDKTINGQTVKNILKIESASFWHYYKFNIYYQLRNFIYDLTEIKLLAEQNHKLILFTDNIIYSNKRISSFLPSQVEIKYKTRRLKKSYLSMFKYLVFLFLRFIFSGNKNILKGKHIILDTAVVSEIISCKDLKPINGNYILEYLFEKLNRNYLILRENPVPDLFKNNFRFTLNDFRKKHIAYTFFGEKIWLKYFFSLKIKKELKKGKQLIKQGYSLISKNASTLNEIVIAKILEGFQGSLKVFLFKYLAYKKVFRNNQIKSISGVDENSPFVKCILDAAKHLNIPTIGIQHGLIHKLHPAYIYSKSDVADNILCDHTLVWGNNPKRFLIEHGNYDALSVHVVGQPRSDIIPQLLKNIPTRIKPPYIDNRKTILFASQPQRDAKLRYQAAFDIFSVVKNLVDTQVVVKLHPGEKNARIYYHNIAKSAGCQNYIVAPDTDLYLMLALSHIVITCFSTVGAEAVYFNKPLIIIDPLRQDIQKYHALGIAHQATDQKSLDMLIKNILNDKLHINKAAYNKFILDYAFKIDGQTNERIKTFIEQF